MRGASSCPRRAALPRCSRRPGYLSAEFLLGPHLANNMVNLGITETAARPARSWTWTSSRSSRPRRSRGSATAASAGSPPATWTRWPRCRSRPSATASATSSASSTRSSSTAGRWSAATPGCATATPGRSRARRSAFPVGFGGHTEQYTDEHGARAPAGIPDLVVNGVGYDTPIMGYGVGNVNLLRLWKSEAPESFDFQAFNVGDYYGAVHAKIEAETISKVLYPNDEPEAGKELRLKQQYFFVSCSLQDMIRCSSASPAASRLPREVRRPAQRHPPGAGRRRADAPADGRARHGLGPGLGDHPQHLPLHQPHPAAGGAGDLAGGPVRAPAAAPPGDHLRDQPPLPRTRCACASSATRRASRACR
jgi:hypothetical protein